MGLLKSADGQSRPIEAQLARLYVATPRRLSRGTLDRAIGEQMHAGLFTQHLRKRSKLPGGLRASSPPACIQAIFMASAPGNASR
jgi:hypothetical protein